MAHLAHQNDSRQTVSISTLTFFLYYIAAHYPSAWKLSASFHFISFKHIDDNENENENSESKQSEQNSLDNNSNSDDEQKRGNSGDSSNSLEIKREQNENCSTKIDRNDGENNTVNNGELNMLLI